MALQIEASTFSGILAGAFFFGAFVGRVARSRARVDAPLLPPLPRRLPDDVPPAVLEALAAGKKIEAIRAFRQATGCDLKTAKELCDELARATPGPAPAAALAAAPPVQKTTGAR